MKKRRQYSVEKEYPQSTDGPRHRIANLEQPGASSPESFRP
jgi:hypothetical protein